MGGLKCECKSFGYIGPGVERIRLFVASEEGERRFRRELFSRMEARTA